jgi:hypothetical protein
VIAPYVLAATLFVVMLAWARRPKSSRSVAFVMLWSLLILPTGIVFWARAAMSYWPYWAFATTWVFWFVIGCGAIFWIVLAMRMAEDEPPEPPAKTPGPPRAEANYVAPQAYGSSAEYVFKGPKRKGRK